MTTTTHAWQIWVDERPAVEQMPVDVQTAAEGVAAARFFLWPEPAVSLGWKQPAPAWVQAAEGLCVVERPTAGGLALHGSDVSCGVVLPTRAERSLRTAMATICEVLADGCRLWAGGARAVTDVPASERVTVCLTEPSPYGVYVGPRKVAGFAVRRFPTSWLIQGSCLIGELPEALQRALPAAVRNELRRHAISLSAAAGTALRPRDVAEMWASRWTSWMEARQ